LKQPLRKFSGSYSCGVENLRTLLLNSVLLPKKENMRTGLWLLAALLPGLRAGAQIPELPLKKGMEIRQSCRIKKGEYLLSGNKNEVFQEKNAIKSTPAIIRISGNNLTVDFQEALLQGAAKGQLPGTFSGLAIRITGKNVTLRNARIQGYKVAILAENAEGLTLDNCDVSYNYRPRLYSYREREDFSDWLSYHHNEQDEWLRYGAGIYLKNCIGATVKGCKASANQNALLLSGCRNCTVYNNTFQFNSGLGIGMYRSSYNKVMHNRLDWNVRGYSHGFYQRGQDSAGILVYEQSSNNLFAYNSATHSGDGFFLWAGQQTMDSGEGGCNDNWLFGNDFSHAPANGIEVTFSRNHIQGNYITECTYGIWGGYSYGSHIHGNLISDCKTGIAIEHGQNDTLRQNFFKDDSTGIALWARAEQPADWVYAQKRDTRSRDMLIDRNVFQEVRKPLKISASQNISVNGENLFFGFEQVLSTEKPNDQLKFWRNDLYAPAARVEAQWQHPELATQRKLNFDHPDKTPDDLYAPLQTPMIALKEPDSLPGGMMAGLPYDGLRGRQYIIMGDWGPYDFKRPLAVLDRVEGNTWYFKILGPQGNWSVVGHTGCSAPSISRGLMPAAFSVTRDPANPLFQLDFEFYSPETVVTELGESIPPSKTYRFQYRRFEKNIDWKLRWYPYDEANDPVKNPLAFQNLLKGSALKEQQQAGLAFAWWGAPAEGIPADHFATLAEATLDIEAGEYTLTLSSDDGVRLYVDGKKVLDHWDVHEPATDEVRLRLGGRHQLRIEHFDATGFSTLDFRLRP
jgi:parallel beta-helix repeat protein